MGAGSLFGAAAPAAAVAAPAAAAASPGILASLAGFFSDPRLKENIKPVGVENGHNVYEFNYRGGDTKYIGVMADEVLETVPDAVHEVNGYLAVDYSKIGVNFRESVTCH
jgi:hypothetical protein